MGGEPSSNTVVGLASGLCYSLLLLALKLITSRFIDLLLLECLVKLQGQALILGLGLLELGLHVVDNLAERELGEVRLLRWLQVQVLYVSVVDVAVNLLEDSRDGVLLGNVSSIAVLASIVLHELHSGLHASQVGRHINQVLILLQALGLQISLVNVEVQHNLEEGLQRGSGAVNALESVETQWRDAISIECFELLSDLIQFRLNELQSFLEQVKGCGD